MSEPPPHRPDSNDGAEALDLRARPAPVAKLSRIMVAGVIAGIIFVLAALVLLSLDPPDWFRPRAVQELYAPQTKPRAEGLERLPTDYDRVPRPADSQPKQPFDDGLPDGALRPFAEVRPGAALDGGADDERLEADARKAGLFFPLRGGANTQAKAPPREGDMRATGGPPDSASSFAALTPGLTGHGAETAAEQSANLSFLKTGPGRDVLNPHSLQTPVSPFQIMAGTVIAASLVTGLNSDLPGFVIAQVTEPVYDTRTGRHLLIPQGSRLIGRYDARIGFGQNRALVVWQRLIRPDGSSIVIDNLPATDVGGSAGLTDRVDHHAWKLFQGAVLATLLSAGAELSSSDDDDLAAALRDGGGDAANRAGQKVFERNLNVQPTIKVRPGWLLRVIVHKDLVLPPYPKVSKQ
ncbi:MAG: TrbI/VirB10 family protein [Hyphomicrobiales bacterium]|nr:TrbI/VirB10 family protein [Hyphomicrobiales bacterium]